MSKIKIGIKIKQASDDFVWTEEFDVDGNTDVELYGRQMIERFNNGLRKDEEAREFVSVEILGNVQQEDKPKLVAIKDNEKRILSQIESLLSDIGEHGIVCTIMNGTICFHDYTVNYGDFWDEDEFIEHLDSHGGYIQPDIEIRLP